MAAHSDIEGMRIRASSLQCAAYDTLGNGETQQSFRDAQPIPSFSHRLPRMYVSRLLTLPVDRNLAFWTLLCCVRDHHKHLIRITGK